jgi:hypothetical protein
MFLPLPPEIYIVSVYAPTLLILGLGLLQSSSRVAQRSASGADLEPPSAVALKPAGDAHLSHRYPLALRLWCPTAFRTAITGILLPSLRNALL